MCKRAFLCSTQLNVPECQLKGGSFADDQERSTQQLQTLVDINVCKCQVRNQVISPRWPHMQAFRPVCFCISKRKAYLWPGQFHCFLIDRTVWYTVSKSKRNVIELISSSDSNLSSSLCRPFRTRTPLFHTIPLAAYSFT